MNPDSLWISRINLLGHQAVGQRKANSQEYLGDKICYNVIEQLYKHSVRKMINEICG